MAGFHEVLYPLALTYGARGGPERRTEIVTLGSGDEERNSLWRQSRRSYNAGPGLKSMTDIETLTAFFEERRGQLYGFRWFDLFDNKSCPAAGTPAATDQPIGSGTGALRAFQLVKTYGRGHAPYARAIRKPVAGTVKVAIGGVVLPASGYTVDVTTGIITLAVAPSAGAVVTAGFEFHVPVRFATDRLEFSFAAFRAGDIPDVPVIEVRR